MATKAKPKAKAPKKSAGRTSVPAKPIRLKAKAPKVQASNGSSNGAKPRLKTSVPRSPKDERVESARAGTVSAGSSNLRSGTLDRSKAKPFDSAVQAYEAGLKLMHAEEFEKAIRCFQDLISEH